MKEKTKIYVLIEPITLKIRYIGITCTNLNKRLDGHLHEAKYKPECNRHKSNWILKMLRMGCKPIIRQIAELNSRKEAEELETLLITKYITKHNLVNISLDNGQFNSESSSKINSKEIHVYDYTGVYKESYDSIIECSEKLDICYSTIKKCITKQYKYAKGFQFNLEKVEKMETLVNYGNGNSKQVIILDNESGEIITFKSGVECKDKLNLNIQATQIIRILGELNKQYGDKYTMLIEGKFTQSTYYNTSVVIETSENTYNFESKKELLNFMGYKVKSINQDKLLEYINKCFKNINNIYFNRPLCEVTCTGIIGEFRENP